MDFRIIFDELRNETDRACAVLARGILETHLKTLLSKRFDGNLSSKELKELFEGNGALSTFSSRIKVCYAFGLIRKLERDALNAMEDISNKFAHSVESKLTFEDIQFKQKIESTALFQLFWNGDDEDEEIKALKVKTNTTRLKFELVLGALVGCIHQKEKLVERLPEAKMSFPPIF